MRFDQIWFRYARRAKWALQAVEATVQPGETVVVLGRNGAGKSTLLQLAAGVLEPSRGAVRDRPRIVGFVLLTGWAAAWCAAALGGYYWLRRRRS